MKIKNKFSNATGLTAMNLALHNQWVMNRYWDREGIKTMRLGYTWKNFFKYLFTGWFHKNAIWKCRLVK